MNELFKQCTDEIQQLLSYPNHKQLLTNSQYDRLATQSIPAVPIPLPPGRLLVFESWGSGIRLRRGICRPTAFYLKLSWPCQQLMNRSPGV